MQGAGVKYYPKIYQMFSWITRTKGERIEVEKNDQ